MGARSKAAPDKPLTLYRVFIDYAAAGIQTASSTADKKIYENKAGVNQKINAALNMGVHPSFIQVMSITAQWQPAADYADKACICGVPWDEPNEACPKIPEVERINAARERARMNPRYATEPHHQELMRPHPELFVIEEVDLVG